MIFTLLFVGEIIPHSWVFEIEKILREILKSSIVRIRLSIIENCFKDIVIFKIPYRMVFQELSATPRPTWLLCIEPSHSEATCWMVSRAWVSDT